MSVRSFLFIVGFLLAFVAPTSAADLKIISFNIQFLGNSHDRRNADLVDMLAPFDIVFVQELVAPPYAGTFPDGSEFVPDPEAAAFFDEMLSRGFDYVLSEEDTGTGPTIHLNSAATEWFVAFFKPNRVEVASDLSQGFLQEDRSDSPDFERVPYAFAFRADGADLVFISVHLKPDPGPANRARRTEELTAIFSWIAEQPGSEQDYVILGDMNFQNCAEVDANLPAGFATLNDPCEATNVKPDSGKPFDHVFFAVETTSNEINTDKGMTVISLIEEMRARWDGDAQAFPGDPYDHDEFRSLYSDHHPIRFNVRINHPDDD